MEYRKINKSNFVSLIEKLNNAGKTFIAPVKKGNKTFFAKVNSFDAINFDYIQTELSPKGAIFPKVEKLFDFYKKDNSYEIIEPEINDEVIIFGIKPCDAIALDYFVNFYLSDFPDTYVKKRREKTTIISLTCKNSDDNCFCTSVGLSPTETRGADLCFTEIDNNDFYIEIVTDKGKNLIDNFSELFETSGKINTAKYAPDIPIKFNKEDILKILKDNFENEKWLYNSLPCVGCGTCAFVCPTCTCFDIQDCSYYIEGSRYRIWDSCAFGLFTVHASGHNPRPVQSNRWRHRIMHKLNYSYSNMSTISCVGCGRCIRTCPTGMNILQNIISFQEV